jgi:TonB-linked SusC/RagA family outer membrane protein
VLIFDIFLSVFLRQNKKYLCLLTFYYQIALIKLLKMRKLLMTFIGLLVAATFLVAQTRVITGKVLDEKGAPITNASVLVKGTTFGTTTKEDGSFSLTVPANSKELVISSVNFVKQEIKITSSNTYATRLKATSDDLEEVVVTGYQLTKKREVNSAVSTISGKQIQNIPVTSVDRLLQGRAAGVQVNANNGIPGGAINILIRGAGSINAGNQPLFIVDGIQMNNSTTSILTQTNPIAFLNPNDIESFEILKDAAATSIYGARGGNGVVLITTKKGKAGRNEVNFNVQFGSTQPLKFFDIMNISEIAQTRIEAVQNANPRASAAAVRANALAGLGIATSATDADIANLRNYDWQQEGLRNGSLQQFEASLRGGNEKTTYYISGSYNNTDAIIFPVNFKRGTLLTSLTHKVSKKVSVETSVSLSTIRQNAPFGGAGGGAFLGNIAFAGATILPHNPIRNADGSWYGLPGSGQAVAGILSFNPMAVNALNTSKQVTNQMVGSFTLNYDIIKGLRYTGKVGMDYRLVQTEFYGDPRLDEYFNRRGFGAVNSNWNTNFLTFHTLNYGKTFNGKHNVSALAGLEYRSDINEQIGASAEGFPTPDFRTVNSAATPLGATGFWTGNKIFSLFGRVGYDYDKRYSITFSARRDGSSRFGASNRFATFPSVSMGWNVTNEKFMERSSNWLSNLKLRYSWGQSGNDQIGNFDALGLFGGGRQYNNTPGIFYSQLASPTLRWESRTENNFGMDLGLFKDRITASVDVYKRINSDLLLNRSLYLSTGFTSFTDNVGEVINEGVEATVQVKIIDKESLKWRTSFVFAYNKNYISKLYDGLQVLPGNNAIRVGAPLGSFFVANYAGVNPSTGRALWYKADGSLTYNPLIPADQRLSGQTIPVYSGGFENVFSHKNWELTLAFNYEYGRTVSDGQVNFMSETGGRAFNGLQSIYDSRWTKPGQITSVPRPFNGNTDFNSSGRFTGQRYLFKADYIRLRTLMLAYNLTDYVKKAKISLLRIYFQGNNLYTYGDYPGYDPEFVGGATGIVPQSKNITVGLQIGF